MSDETHFAFSIILSGMSPSCQRGCKEAPSLLILHPPGTRWNPLCSRGVGAETQQKLSKNQQFFSDRTVSKVC